jgi:hypothetical protein
MQQTKTESNKLTRQSPGVTTSYRPQWECKACLVPSCVLHEGLWLQAEDWISERASDSSIGWTIH